MAEIRVMAQRSIAAPAEEVYRYIADYRTHHPRFLPPAFSAFQVDQGGVGEGTIMRFRVRAGGRTRAFHQRVTEPTPGRVLVESGMQSSEATTFTVTPEGTASWVRIETHFEDAGGVRGFVERLLAPRFLQPLYAEELERLDRYAQERAAGH